MEQVYVYLDSFNSIYIKVDKSTLLHPSSIPYFLQNKTRKYNLSMDKQLSESEYRFLSDEEIELNGELFFCGDSLKIAVQPGEITRLPSFDEKFSLPPDELLGAVYSREDTIFKVWSPVAWEIDLILDSKTFKMTSDAKGLWTYTYEGDTHLMPYYYNVTIGEKVNRVVDPYTKTLSKNDREGVVVDLSRTDPSDFRKTNRPELKSLQDASIYELHVRDATIDVNSGVMKSLRGKYLGLTEKGTRTPNGFTSGLDYLKELGVTHIQFLPLNDFGRVDDENPDKHYNWGYDPLFFQAPEGTYATDPLDPLKRISELKKLIQTFHEEGLMVIQDVVFNHVFIAKESSFEKLIPGYYFRFDSAGNLSNGTGVGNDISSEKRMVRKFILDTIDYFLKEYKIDGFRFDLMGILDITTMQKIYERTLEEDQPIMLLGEGWELNTSLPYEEKATSHQSQQLEGIRFFNDLFRETISGNLHEFDQLGYANGKGRYIERIPHLIKGSAGILHSLHPFVSQVTQTINYIESHDNHTYWDRIIISNKEERNDNLRKIQRLATGIVLLSQGVPFLHAGQEWMATKNGDGDSYISGDEINKLDWIRRETHEEDIQFVRELIKLRNEYEEFRLQSAELIERRLRILQTPSTVFGFVLLGIYEDLAVFINPTDEKHQVRMPSSGNWDIVICSGGTQHFSNDRIYAETTVLVPYEFLVLKKIR